MSNAWGRLMKQGEVADHLPSTGIPRWKLIRTLTDEGTTTLVANPAPPDFEPNPPLPGLFSWAVMGAALEGEARQSNAKGYDLFKLIPTVPALNRKYESSLERAAPVKTQTTIPILTRFARPDGAPLPQNWVEYVAGAPEERAVTPSQDGDVGQLIIGISQQAICINGGFGDVFKGIHKNVGEVALKRLRIGGTGNEDLVIRRFQREADIWCRLQHPHILKFLGTYIHETHLHLVSPFMNNGTLLEYVKDRLGANRVRLLCEAASAVDYLHQTRIVHGDIKASNLLISDDDRVLLCDFGLAKVMDAQIPTTLKGAGTVRWQSPELWDGAPKTFESDVYAFSMTIAEVLTGAPPFAHLHLEMAVMKAVYIRSERPNKAPMECNGVSYENAWKVAELCWSTLQEERIPISDALRRLREDPSLV
ncbi:hypothetical protein M407DRAFT_29160 [Tulasnella calospora MUT 4182]|uniref:Protein kinase domain-containing protein n=1 Tax=Tulasnella calospora MUT 4182 TaxID=1051891 RepID=A0A0C3Q9H0_9AGAM|nr:hypothetical protein M407DRAFT_29160 [Tulasnella calospora MUT 4182]